MSVQMYAPLTSISATMILHLAYIRLRLQVNNTIPVTNGKNEGRVNSRIGGGGRCFNGGTAELREQSAAVCRHRHKSQCHSHSHSHSHKVTPHCAGEAKSRHFTGRFREGMQQQQQQIFPQSIAASCSLVVRR
jgi:hypothetical protein